MAHRQRQPQPQDASSARKRVVKVGPAPEGWEDTDETKARVVQPTDPRSRKSVTEITVTVFWTPAPINQIVVTEKPGYGLVAEGQERSTFLDVWTAVLHQTDAGKQEDVQTDFLYFSAINGKTIPLSEAVGTRPKFRLCVRQQVDQATDARVAKKGCCEIL
eukprot:m51a1_g4710 hypothetical protein (161) ;mRNA; r:290492-291070